MEVDEIETVDIHKIYWSLHYDFKSHPNDIITREEELILIKLVALKYGLNDEFNLCLKKLIEDGSRKTEFRKKIISLFDGKPGFNYFLDTGLFDFIDKLPPGLAFSTMETLDRLEFKNLDTHIEIILDASLNFLKNLEIRKSRFDHVNESTALTDFWEEFVSLEINSKVLFPSLMNFKSVLKIMDKYKFQKIQFSIFDTDHIKIERFKLYCVLFNLSNTNTKCCNWLIDEEIIHSFNGYFDTIINMPSINSKVTVKIPDPENYPASNGKMRNSQDLEIEKSLSFLNSKGSSFTLVPISTLFNTSPTTKNLRKYLLNNSLLKRVISLPSGMVHGVFLKFAIMEISKQTSTNVQFSDAAGCFEKYLRNHTLFIKKNSKEFIKTLWSFKELENRIILKNNKIIEIDPYDIDPKQFVNDSHGAKQLRALMKNYKEYDQINLCSDNICEKIHRHFKRKKIEYNNAVNINQSFRMPINSIKNIDKADIKDRSYVLEFAEKKVLADYIVYFLETELGKLIINESASDTNAQFVNGRALKNIDIPIPPLKLQKNIIEAANKIKELNITFTSITSELGNNPTSVSTINDKLNGILDSLNMLSDTEKSLSLILKGENQFVEFKETLSIDVKRKKNDTNYKVVKEAEMEKSVIKTIAAFLNTKGGDLFIGVDDHSEIIGLEDEMNIFYKGSSDKFLLHLNNLINTKFSDIITHLLDIKLINCNEKLIVQITVSQSSKEIFVEDTQFYYRANPSTEQLVGSKMIAYIKQNFN